MKIDFQFTHTLTAVMVLFKTNEYNTNPTPIFISIKKPIQTIAKGPHHSSPCEARGNSSFVYIYYTMGRPIL